MSVIPPDEMESLWDDKFIKEQMEKFIERDRYEDIMLKKFSSGSFQKEYMAPYNGTSTEAKVKYDTFKTDIIQGLLEIAADIKEDEAMIKLRGTIAEGEQPEKEVEEESESDLYFDPKDLDI